VLIPGVAPGFSPARAALKGGATFKCRPKGRRYVQVRTAPKSGAHAKDGRFQPAPMLAAQQHADQGPKRGADQKDVKNEECSPEFIENKGAKKVLLMSS
ncbi:MAG: hypothetical protein ABSA59_23940, partial [Terriglobia bacterium]